MYGICNSYGIYFNKNFKINLYIGNAQWKDKGKDGCSILWRKYEEWASLIYKWVFDLKKKLFNIKIYLYEFKIFQ